MRKKTLVGEDQLIACSKGVAESLQKANLKNDICYIRNAIDFSRFDRVECNINYNAKDRFSKLIILMFGFDFERKGVDIALRACDRIIDNGINLKLRICVAVDLDKVVDKTLSTLKVSKVPEWIEFLPPTDHIQKYYEDASVFISPSREEGFPYSLIEAAYCGCLLVASNISGQNELNLDDILWIDSNNVDNLAGTLAKISDLSVYEKVKISKQLHISAFSNYQISRWTNEIIEFYKGHHLI